MEPVKDGQGHGNVSNYGPCPVAPVKLGLNGMGIGPVGLQRVDGPHGQVANQQEGHNLSARLFVHLLRRVGVPEKRGVRERNNWRW